MEKSTAGKIIRKLREYHGKVVPALEYTNVYELTIAVVLSAQTTDRQVNNVSGELFNRYPDFTALAGAKQHDVENIIRSTGFYHAKAGNIIRLAKMVTDSFGGKLPGDREKLMTLPGVGRKSANVILSQGFGIPAFAVDTHVGRLARRIGFTAETDPDKVEAVLISFIPERDWTEGHLLFIIHGRTVCTAKKPCCGDCPIAAFCAYPDKTS